MKRSLGLILIWLLLGTFSHNTVYTFARVDWFPLTGEVSQPHLLLPVEELPDLFEFNQQVQNGLDEQITGLYLPGLAALSVQPQPPGEPFYVTDEPGSVTLFSQAELSGSIGLLAHGHLAGEAFAMMTPGQPVVLIYGDGQMASYEVIRLESYQALEPDNPYSQFVSLQDGSRWDSQALFSHLYASGSNLIFQTCLGQDGQANWGRLFVVALPSSQTASKLAAKINPTTVQ